MIAGPIGKEPYPVFMAYDQEKRKQPAIDKLDYYSCVFSNFRYEKRLSMNMQ